MADGVWDEVQAKVLNEATLLNGELRFKSVGKVDAEKYLTRLLAMAENLRKKNKEMPYEAREAFTAISKTYVMTL